MSDFEEFIYDYVKVVLVKVGGVNYGIGKFNY